MFVRSFFSIGVSLLFAATGSTAQFASDATVPTDLTTGMLDVSEIDDSLDLPETGRMLSGCKSGRVISSENFENGKTTGWHRGRIDHAPAFTKFLGRYGKNDKNKGPSKTYNIPKDTKQVIFQFDFYEIDSWDSSHKDYLCVVFDGKMVDVGTFDTHKSENGRKATRNKVSFEVKSLTSPKNIGFNHKWKDQKHRITMYVPNSFYKTDGKLKVQFQVNLNEDINNESAGFDNIRLTTICNGGGNQCTAKKIVDDDFQDHRDFHGWKNGKKDHSHKLTTFLGRYAKEDRNKVPEKTFGGINKNTDKVKLMIDFYEIDSWDGTTKYGPDLLWIRIDNVKLAIGPFQGTVDEKAKSGSAGGISWSSKSLGKPAHLGFNKKYKDQKHRFTIFIPNQYYKADGKITIKLGAEVTSSKHDESAGWDNIKIYELNNCGRRLGEIGDSDPLMEDSVVDDAEYDTEEDNDTEADTIVMTEEDNVANTDADTTVMTTIESLVGSMLTPSEGTKLRGAAVA